MQDNREDLIRKRAHELWEREGRPDGREADHWQQAASEIDGEEGRPRADAGLPPAGMATGLQPGGTVPGGGPGESMGSMGTGGASTGRRRRKA